MTITFFQNRFIHLLEDQISLHKKQQFQHELHLKRLYGRIAYLETQLRVVACSRCKRPGHRMVCLPCLNRDNLVYEQRKRIQETLLRGPACNACRVQKRKCDRQNPHCTYCVSQGRRKAEEPNCNYVDKKKDLWYAESAYPGSVGCSTKHEDVPSITHADII